ncbi:unnamed protein product, partial [Rotaria sordida]
TIPPRQQHCRMKQQQQLQSRTPPRNSIRPPW